MPADLTSGQKIAVVDGLEDALPGLKPSSYWEPTYAFTSDGTDVVVNIDRTATVGATTVGPFGGVGFTTKLVDAIIAVLKAPKAKASAPKAKPPAKKAPKAQAKPAPAAARPGPPPPPPTRGDRLVKKAAAPRNRFGNARQGDTKFDG